MSPVWLCIKGDVCPCLAAAQNTNKVYSIVLYYYNSSSSHAVSWVTQTQPMISLCQTLVFWTQPLHFSYPRAVSPDTAISLCRTLVFWTQPLHLRPYPRAVSWVTQTHPVAPHHCWRLLIHAPSHLSFNLPCVFTFQQPVELYLTDFFIVIPHDWH